MPQPIKPDGSVPARDVAGATVALDPSTMRVLRALARRRGRTVEEELRSLVRHGAEGEAARISGADLLAGFERFREAERSVSLDELRRASNPATDRDDH